MKSYFIYIPKCLRKKLFDSESFILSDFVIINGEMMYKIVKATSQIFVTVHE